PILRVLLPEAHRARPKPLSESRPSQATATRPLSASGAEIRYRSTALECRMATEFEKRDQQSEIKQLITKGKEQGFLTYAEVNDHLPDDIVDPEQIEDIISMINDMGIEVHETAPDAESLLLQETPAAQDDETATEEAIQALSAVEEAARTT